MYLSDIDPLMKEQLKILEEKAEVIDHPDYLYDEETGLRIEVNTEKVKIIPNRGSFTGRDLPIVTTENLKDAISKLSGYYPYEVEDVLNALIVVFRRHLLEGRRVQFKGIGTFYISEMISKMPDSFNKPSRAASFLQGSVRKNSYLRGIMDTHMKKRVKATKDKRIKIRERLARIALKRKLLEEKEKLLQQNSDTADKKEN